MIRKILIIFLCIPLLTQVVTSTAQADETFNSGNNILYYSNSACSPAKTSIGTGLLSIPSYQNPVIANRSAPDPSVIKGDDGKFYLFATGFQQFVSDDLVNWKLIDGHDGYKWIKNAPNWDVDRWAPDIVKIDDTYFLSISGRGSGSTNRTIGYASAKSAAGPFTYQGELLNSSDRGIHGMGYDIDPNIINTNEGIFLYYGSGTGFISVAKLTKNGNSLNAAKAKKVFTTKNPEGPVMAEGAYVYKSGKYYYLYFSTGDWRNGSYKTRVARSVSPLGPFDEKNTPILQANSEFSGPGHNSVIGDGAGNDYTFYTVYKKGDPDNHRSTALDKITYQNDWPVINNNAGPSSKNQKSSLSTAAGQNITVFGDSLTVGMKNQGNLASKLTGAGWKVQSITAQGGKNIGWLRNQLNNTSVRKSVSNSDKVVIAMGTNIDGEPESEIKNVVSDIKKINEDIDISWVNVFTPQTSTYRTDFNTILDRVSPELGVGIIDWNSEASLRENYYKFSNDGVHHLKQGYARKADFIIKSLKGSSTQVDIANNETTATTCCSENSLSDTDDLSSGSSLDAYLKAMAMQESGGDPKIRSSISSAAGKYQYLTSTWASRYDLYPPASKYSTADQAPENIQDAVVYIEYAQKWKEFNGDIFKLALSHFYPLALTDPSVLDKLIGGNSITPRQYAEAVVKKVQEGYGAEIPLSYSSAPDFQKHLSSAVDGGFNAGAAPVQTSAGCGSSDSSEVSEGGLTEAQAKALAIRYGANKNNDSINAMNAGDGKPSPNCTGGPLSNCTSFSAFFTNKFSSDKFQGGDGGDVVSNMKAKGIPTGSAPKPFAVFSWRNSSYGHTGVVLGIEGDTIIVGHASCSSPGTGPGDGTKEGGGAAYIKIGKLGDASVFEGKYPTEFAYPENIDTKALGEYSGGSINI